MTNKKIEECVEKLRLALEEIDLLKSYFEDTREIVLHVNDVKPLIEESIFDNISLAIKILERLEDNKMVPIITQAYLDYKKETKQGEDNWISHYCINYISQAIIKQLLEE